MIPQSVTHVANGGSVAFTFPFSIFEPLDMEVLVNGVVQDSGFSLVGIGSCSGGAVRFDSAPLDTTVVTLRRTGKVQVSGSDAPGFLETKIIASANISVTKTTDTAGEHLAIASTIDPSAFATAAQGAKADSALQPADIGGSVQAHDADLDWLAEHISVAGKALLDDADAAAQRATLGLSTVAASGSYGDLSDRPTLGSAAALGVDTDGTLTANSDSHLPSQKAVKTYVDAKVASLANSDRMIEDWTAINSLTLMIGSSVSSGAVLDAYRWKLSTDEWAAGSNGYVFTPAMPAFANIPLGYNRIIDGTATCPNFGGTATNINDANAASYVSAAIPGSQSNTALAGRIFAMIDYGSNRQIAKVEVVGVANDVQAGGTCHLLCSSDGSTWTQLDTFTAPSGGIYCPGGASYPQTFNWAGTPVSARFVAVTIPAMNYGSNLFWLGGLNAYTFNPGAEGCYSNPTGNSYIGGGTASCPNFGGTAVNINDGSASTYVSAAIPGNKSGTSQSDRIFAMIDYGSNRQITKVEAVGVENDVLEGGICELLYSTDGSTWSQLSTFTAPSGNAYRPGGASYPQSFAWAGTAVTARYIAVTIPAMNYNGNQFCLGELNGYTNQNPANITLLTPTISVSAAPSALALYFLWKDDSGSATAGTDLTVELSRDGGATWTTATIVQKASFDGVFDIYKARAVVDTQPSGLFIKARIKTLNNKAQRIGAALIVPR